MLITQGTWLTYTLSVEWFLWAAERLTGNKCYDHPTPQGSLQLHWEHFEAHHSCQQLADFTAQMLSQRVNLVLEPSQMELTTDLQSQG